MALEAPTNYLDLCQRLVMECGIPGGGPSTVVGQTGELQRVVAWINAAWTYIQSLHQDWDWLRTSASWTTTSGQETYTTLQCGITAGTFGRWVRHTFRVYTTSVGTDDETFLDYIPYDDWRDAYFYSAFRNTTARPVVFTITPAKSIALGPPPTGDYTVTGDYWTAPSTMAADADIPAIPAQHILAIVYRAMMHYGTFENAPEVYQHGQMEYMKILKQLEADRIPEVGFAGALV